MSLFLCPRAPLIPSHHLEISCGRQYCQITTYYIHPNYYSWRYLWGQCSSLIPFHLGFSFLLQELLFLGTLLVAAVLVHKDVTQEVQWIDRWELSALGDVLFTVNGVLCTGIDLLGLRLNLLILPLIRKEYIHEMVHVAWIICWEDCISGQCSLVICQDPVVKGIITILNRSNPAVRLLLGSGNFSLAL